MARRNNSPIDNFAPHQLRELRARAGLTAEQLGDAAGVPRPNIVAYESGRRSPSFGTVIALADAVGADPLELTTANTGEWDLADLRLRARLTRNALAEIVGVSYATWYAVEQGRRSLTADIAERAAAALAVDAATVRAAHARSTRQHARLVGHPVTTARHFALAHRLDQAEAARPATEAWTLRRVNHILQVSGLDPSHLTVITDPASLAELTGITIGPETLGLAERRPAGNVVYVDPAKTGTRGDMERLIAHEIAHLRWPSLGHRGRFFERVQQLLDAA